MQILVVLGLGALLLGLMGTAYLGEQNGEIDLLVQALGWGEKTIEVPITDAEVEIRLDTIPGINQEPSQTIVKACGFHSDEPMDEVENSLSDGRIICKLLNEDGNAILEGSMTFTSYVPSSTIVIDMNQPIFEDAILFKNGFNMRVIVQGPIGQSK
ncbi:MAG: hypothetical protein O6761_04960 [Thaumarchaeota archaeon]|nr:hypothetical protein [Nitrososphaerota archaeon]